MQRRYHTLDGLRGVAAIVVCFGHSSLWLTPLPVPQGCLAVDLFFILSGFVIAKAYDGRFAQSMNARQFMLQRYLRLYPIYAVGLIIGFASAALTLALRHGAMTGTQLTLATLSGLLMLPSPTWKSISEIVPLNHPAWSLIYEIGVNVLFALIWRWLRPLVLMAIVAVSGVIVIVLYIYGDCFAGPFWVDAWMGIPRNMLWFFLRRRDCKKLQSGSGNDPMGVDITVDIVLYSLWIFVSRNDDIFAHGKAVLRRHGLYRLPCFDNFRSKI